VFYVGGEILEKIKANVASGKRTKEKLYRTAISFFEEKGYDNITIKDITEKANVAKGTFYVHFKSKRDLVYYTREIYDEIANETYNKISVMPTFREQFISYLTISSHHVKYLGTEIMKDSYCENLIDDNVSVTRPRRGFSTALRKIVEFGIDTGELSNEKSADDYMEIVMMCVIGLDYYWCSGTADDVDIEKLANSLATIFCDGAINGGKNKL